MKFTGTIDIYQMQILSLYYAAFFKKIIQRIIYKICNDMHKSDRRA